MMVSNDEGTEIIGGRFGSFLQNVFLFCQDISFRFFHKGIGWLRRGDTKQKADATEMKT